MEKDEGKKSRNKYSADKITLEHFVSTMVPLIDMEKEAEISISMNSGAMRSLDIAQKKGSTILSLKCVDAQGYWESHSWSFTLIREMYYLLTRLIWAPLHLGRVLFTE
ncbi:uncharacterized protein [Primulina eburnea]|uniref:uncharacterized protein isoform X3 n=1 Tax=Primulina eburnea TaxID=1245227 RepID=UPI003C6CBC36